MFLCNLLRRSPLFHRPYSATKRCLRVEPPLHALRRDVSPPPPKLDPNSPRLFSSRVGQQPSLHDSEDDCFEINSIAKAAALISPSVVNLQTTKDLYGSGTIINEKGRIITCAHNVFDLKKFKRSQVYQYKGIEVMITLSDGHKFRGTVCDCDSDYDLALIKLKALKMSICPAKFRAYSDASVGDWVVSVGNPFNYYANTVSKGIISGSWMEACCDGGGAGRRPRWWLPAVVEMTGGSGRRRRRRWPVTVVTGGRGGRRRWGWK